MSAPLGRGELAPGLDADGWFNGDAPSPEDLRGNVVVVEVWAYW